MGKLIQFIRKKFNRFTIKYFPLTKYRFNMFRYAAKGKRLSLEYKLAPGSKFYDIVQTIKKDGIAVVKIEDLFPDKTALNDLLEEFQTFSNTKDFKDALQKGESKDSKNYLIRSGYFNKTLAVETRLFKMAVSSPFLSIVTNYLGSVPRLQFAEYWYTIPQKDSGSKNSQSWHRDPEFSMIKVFLYLNEVDNNAGPFCYIKGTHQQGEQGNILPRKTPNGPFYPSEKEIFDKIDKSNIVVNTGSLGTLIFCDTNGFHKGGDAKLNPRIFAYWTYGGPGTLFGLYFKPTGDLTKLSPAQKFVVEKINL